MQKNAVFFPEKFRFLASKYKFLSNNSFINLKLLLKTNKTPAKYAVEEYMVSASTPTPHTRPFIMPLKIISVSGRDGKSPLKTFSSNYGPATE